MAKRIIIKNGKKYLVTVPDRDPFCDSAGGFIGGSLSFGASAGQYLSINGGTDFVFSTGSFTVEWFQYQISPTSFGRVYTQVAWPNAEHGVSIEGTTADATFYLWLDGLGNTPAVANSAVVSAPRLNRWDHFAVVRQSGSYVQIFRNGVALRTMTGSSHVYITANISSSASLFIGSEGDGVATTRFSGSITNFRMVKGYSLYSQSYAVPTGPLTSVPGTVLLLNVDPSNPFADSSGLNKTVTRNSVSWSLTSPFM